MAKEYIDRDAVIEQIRVIYCGNCNSYNGVRCRACEFDDAMSLVEDAPAADVVEVVRCEHCKHATFYSCKNDACYRGIICEFGIGTGDENFYCSYGERK
jgi:hypothetical protein